MRFLADESCDFTIVRVLRDAGHDVLSVMEERPGISDREVTDWAPYSDNPGAAAGICDILDNWDRRYNLDSVGSHLFFEFFAKVYQFDNLWAVPFNPDEPLLTPRDINVEDPALVESLLYSLGDVVDELVADNIPLDSPWGEIQYAERNGERIGIHGGSGGFMFNAISPSGCPTPVTRRNSSAPALSWPQRGMIPNVPMPTGC